VSSARALLAVLVLLGAGCAVDSAATRSDAMRELRERELRIGRELALGDAALAQGRFEEAQAAYQRVLAVDASQPRARAGLEAVPVARRHGERLQEARSRLQRGEHAGAEALAREVLGENPLHHGARLVLRGALDGAAAAGQAAPVLQAGAGRTVTLEFRDAPLQSVFDFLSRTTGVNFAFDKDVPRAQRASIVVREAGVADVIRLILSTHQLEHKVLNANTVLVYPNTPAKQKEYQETVVRAFYVANADVKQVFNMIRTVVKTRDLYMDENLNLLVMKDTPNAVRLAERLVAAQDLAEPEVVLDVEVLEVGTSRLQELGVRFPDAVQFQDPATVAAPAGTGAATSALQRASAGLVSFVATPPIVLNLRRQDGSTNVLANPRIRVRNREKARVHIGDRVPVITTTSTANVGISASVSYLDVGLKLEVEPTVHLEGEVAIRVGLEVSNIVREVPVSGGGLAYQLGTRNAGTVLRLKDGETQVLAGLIQDDERLTASKLPVLGDLPVLGRLFSSNLDNRAQTEIVLLITPRIVRTLSRPDHVSAQYPSGTDGAVGAPPLLMR
jgi:general secretion pathway protein D